MKRIPTNLAVALPSAQSHNHKPTMSRVDRILSCVGLPTGQAVACGEENAALRKAVSDSHANLLGASAAQQVEVNMWLSFSQRALNQDALSALNATLLYKTYLVGSNVTLADYSVLVAIADTAIASYPNTVRWFSHIRSLSKSFCSGSCTTTKSVPTLLPLPVFDGEKSDPAANTAPVAATEAPAAAAPVAAAAPAASSSSNKKKEKEVKPVAEKAPAVAAEKEDAGNSLDPTKLDIRCGKVRHY